MSAQLSGPEVDIFDGKVILCGQVERYHKAMESFGHTT